MPGGDSKKRKFSPAPKKGGAGGAKGTGPSKKQKTEGGKSKPADPERKWDSEGKPIKKFTKKPMSVSKDQNGEEKKVLTRKDRQALRKERRASKPGHETATAANAVYTVGLKHMKKEERETKIQEILTNIQGKLAVASHKHDASRALQSLIKNGAPAQRATVFNEIKGDLVPLMKHHYAHHIVQKLYQYGEKEIKESIVKSMFGSFSKIALHSHAAPVVDYVFMSEKAEVRAQLLAEIYSPEFALANSSTPEQLRAIFQKSKSKKPNNNNNNNKDQKQSNKQQQQQQANGSNKGTDNHNKKGGEEKKGKGKGEEKEKKGGGAFVEEEVEVKEKAFLEMLLEAYPDKKQTMFKNAQAFIEKVCNKQLLMFRHTHTIIREFLQVASQDPSLLTIRAIKKADSDSDDDGKAVPTNEDDSMPAVQDGQKPQKQPKKSAEAQSVFTHLCELLKENIMALHHSNDGVWVVNHLFAWADAKDRKNLIKQLKGHVAMLSTHPSGSLMLLQSLLTTDDTVLTRKTVLSELDIPPAQARTDGIAHQKQKQKQQQDANNGGGDDGEEEGGEDDGDDAAPWDKKEGGGKGGKKNKDKKSADTVMSSVSQWPALLNDKAGTGLVLGLLAPPNHRHRYFPLNLMALLPPQYKPTVDAKENVTRVATFKKPHRVRQAELVSHVLPAILPSLPKDAEQLKTEIANPFFRKVLYESVREAYSWMQKGDAAPQIDEKQIAKVRTVISPLLNEVVSALCEVAAQPWSEADSAPPQPKQKKGAKKGGKKEEKDSKSEENEESDVSELHPLQDARIHLFYKNLITDVVDPSFNAQLFAAIKSLIPDVASTNRGAFVLSAMIEHSDSKTKSSLLQVLKPLKAKLAGLDSPGVKVLVKLIA